MQGKEGNLGRGRGSYENGRKAIKGRCPTCGTVMFKILGGKANPTPVPSADSPGSSEPSS